MAGYGRQPLEAFPRSGSPGQAGDIETAATPVSAGMPLGQDLDPGPGVGSRKRGGESG